MRAPGPRACLHRCNKLHGTCGRHCAGLPQRGTFSRQLCKDRVRLRLLHRHGRAIGLQTQLYRVGGFCCVQRSSRARRFRTPNRLERLVGAIFRSRCTPQRSSCAQGVPLPRVVRRLKLCARRFDGCQRTVQPEAHGGQVAHNRNAHLPRSTSRSMPVAPWNGGALDIKRRTLYSCSSTQEHAGMGMHATNRAYPMYAGHTEPPMSFVVLSCVL